MIYIHFLAFGSAPVFSRLTYSYQSTMKMTMICNEPIKWKPLHHHSGAREFSTFTEKRNYRAYGVQY